MDKIRKTDMLKLTLDHVYIDEGQDLRYDYGDVRALADSIAECGVKETLFGIKVKGGEQYKIINGHRRIKAIQLLAEEGIDVEIPLRTAPKGYTDAEIMADVLTMNSQKELEMLEQAEVVYRLRNCYLTEDGEPMWSIREIARRWGKSATHVSNLAKLAELSEESKEYVKEGRISASMVLETIKQTESVDEAEKMIAKAVKQKEISEEDKDKKLTPKDVGTEKKVKPSKLDEIIQMLEAVLDANADDFEDEELAKRLTEGKILAENHIHLLTKIKSFLNDELKPEEVYEDYKQTFESILYRDND